MKKTPRVHQVNPGSMPSWTPRQREIMLHTPTRFIAPNNRGAVRSNMGSMCDTFKVYGVNANPFKSGTTSGDGVIVSRRFKLA
jgi:hypothetical protein